MFHVKHSGDFYRVGTGNRLFLYHFLGKAYRGHAIGCIGVSTGSICVFLRQCGTADHDLGRGAGFTQLADHFVNLDHRGRHEGAEAYDVGFIFNGRAHDGFCGDILAEVDELETTVFEQSGYDVFAEVMYITLYGSDDDSAFLRGFLGREHFLEFEEGRAHCFRGKQYLRQKYPAGTEVDADFIHRGGKGFFRDFLGRVSFADGSFYQGGNHVLFAVNDRGFDGRERVECTDLGGCRLFGNAEVGVILAVGTSVWIVA